MINESIDDNFSAVQLAQDVFLGRQAILDREQKLVAYELLSRRTASDGVNANNHLEVKTTVNTPAIDLDLEKLFGALPGFVRVNATGLMNDSIFFFGDKNFILEISESDAAAPNVVERIAKLVQAGFIFALRNVTGNAENVQDLLPLIEIIKIDIHALKGQNQLLQLCDFYKQAHKKLVAEKVETVEQFERCLECGFDSFQGYFFAKPLALTGNKLSPSELSIIHLMALINSDADNADIESQIKRDVTIGLNLLRLVNTPAAGVPHRIGSIRQALLILGRRQLQRWLQILLYTKPGRGGNMAPPPPLLTLASVRGKLLELIAEKLKPGNHAMADMGFTIGIMSLMDSLFSLPMGELLKQIPVLDDVSDALLHRKGFFGEMLTLIEYVEQFENVNAQQILPALNKLHLSIENFNRLQIIAFEWADQISRVTE